MSSRSWSITLQISGSPAVGVSRPPIDVQPMDRIEAVTALGNTVNQPVRIQSFTDYDRIFGGLWRASKMSQIIGNFLKHGGTDAIIVRVFNPVVDIA